jgi:sugar-specific transcriptional regulator TrmB
MSIGFDEMLRRLMLRAYELRKIIAEEEQKLREKQSIADQIFREYMDEIARTPDPRMRAAMLLRLQQRIRPIRNEIYNEMSMIRQYRQQLSIIEANIAREKINRRMRYTV